MEPRSSSWMKPTFGPMPTEANGYSRERQWWIHQSPVAEKASTTAAWRQVAHGGIDEVDRLGEVPETSGGNLGTRPRAKSPI